MTKEQKITIGITVPVCIAVLVLAFYYGIKQMKNYYDSTGQRNYFSDKELTYSSTAKKYGIDNTPNEQQWANLYALRDNVLNPVRRYLNRPVTVNVAFRSEALNRKLIELGKSASPTSQHTKGQAADISIGTPAENKRLFQAIVELGVYDQIIWENNGNWIHVSYNPAGCRHNMLAYSNGTYKNINNNWQTAIGLA